MRYLFPLFSAHLTFILTTVRSSIIWQPDQPLGHGLRLLLLFALYPASLLALDKPYESLHLGSDLSENNSRLFADQSGLPQGGVIILSSAESNDHKLVNLANYLTHYGWTSLITLLPAPAIDTDNAITTTDGNMLALAIEFMQQQGQFNLVLLALNETWPRLYTDSLVGKPPLQGLILLDVDSAAALGGLPKKMPLLDIATERRTPLTFARRKSQAQHYRLAEYQQVSLPPSYPGLTLKEDRFSKRIRGWLLRHVQGMELAE